MRIGEVVNRHFEGLLFELHLEIFNHSIINRCDANRNQIRAISNQP